MKSKFRTSLSLSFIAIKLSLLSCLTILTGPVHGSADLTINDSLVIGTDPDPNGQGWDYTDETIWIGSGSGETGSLTVPTGENLKYFDLILGVGDSTAEGSLIIDGSGALVESSRTGTSGSSLVIGQSGIGNVTISNGGQLQRRGFTLGDEAGSLGNLLITGAGSNSTTVASAGFLTSLGNSGTAIMTLDHGGSFISQGNIRVGRETGGSGTLNILRGGNLTLNSFLHLGATGSGALNITEGGIASIDSNITVGGVESTDTNAEGHVVVDGAGSFLNAGGFLWVGRYGEGTMLIDNNAIVIVEDEIRIGRETSGSGTLDISRGGNLTLNSYMHLGASGNGTLNITEGGTASMTGNLTIGGPGAADTNAEGHAVVDGTGSSLDVGGFIWVGRYGEGTMLIDNGGSVEGTSMRIGREVGGTGSLTVRGSGTSLDLIDPTDGFLWAGDEGNGEFLIEEGATVFAEGTVRLGVNSGSSGVGTVRGAGSTLTSDTWFRIGDEGSGILNIEDGALVESASFVSVSFDPDAEGTVNISGENSTFKSDGFFRVGRTGPGSLNVSDGGRLEVTSGDFTVGSAATASGIATFTGSGSVLDVSEEIVIGSLSTGTLTISDGASASTGSDLFIGAGSTGNGTVTVQDSGTTLSVANNLFIGAELDVSDNPVATNGTGILNVENDSLVTVDGDLFLRGDNSLVMNGGNLDVVGDLDLADSTSELRFILGSDGPTGLSAGNVFLDDTQLDIELTYQPMLGDIITLITVHELGSVTGNFMYGTDQLLQGSIFEVTSNSFEQQFQISYAGSNDVTLTAVPEPTTWGLILGAATLSLVVLRRRLN